MPSSDEIQTFKLHFSNHIRIPGEPLHGSVELDFAHALEDNIQQVSVKLRGVMKTRTVRSGNQSSTTYIETNVLVRGDRILWTKGSTYPEPGMHNLILPFKFVLPNDLPPSFYIKRRFAAGASISYSIEVVGDRPGLFRSDRRLGVIFPVLGRASSSLVSTRLTLLGGWQGEWRSASAQDQIRQRPWGDYSRVAAKLALPDLQLYPTGVPIPFRLEVTTQTKSMRRDDHPAPRADDKSLFPSPPLDPAQIMFQLDNDVWIKALDWTNKARCPVQKELGGLGASEGSELRNALQVDAREPVWIPDEADKEGNGKGAWSRTVVFESAFTLSCPPTLSLPTMRCNYLLHFKVPLPGMFNNHLKCDIPIAIDSGLDLPPPLEGEDDPSSITAYEQHDRDTALMMDLPPAYWAGEDHEWDLDEKK